MGAGPPSGRTGRPSYVPGHLTSLAEEGRLDLLDGDAPIAPGVEAVMSFDLYPVETFETKKPGPRPENGFY